MEIKIPVTEKEGFIGFWDGIGSFDLGTRKFKIGRTVSCSEIFIYEEGNSTVRLCVDIETIGQELIKLILKQNDIDDGNEHF